MESVALVSNYNYRGGAVNGTREVNLTDTIRGA